VLKFLVGQAESGDMTREIASIRMLELARRAALAALALALGAAPLAAAAEMPQLAVVEGAVQIGAGSPERWRDARVGDALAAGEMLRTGVNGFAELETAVGRVRIFPSSLLRLPASFAEAPERVDLDRGTSVFDIERRPGGQRFEVHSPLAVVMVKGTRFLVSAEPESSRVEVARGLVSVREPGADSGHGVLVRPGFAALGGPGSPFALSLLDAGADAWDAWSRREAPELRSPRDPRSAQLDAREAAQTAAARAADRRLERLVEVPAAAERGLQDGVRPKRVENGVQERAAELRRADFPDRSAETRGSLTTEMREAFTSAALGGGTGGSPGVLVELVSGSGGPGSDRVQISGQGFAAQLNHNQVEQVMSGHAHLLGPQVLGLLESRGIDPVAFAKQLDALFPR
jgi:hypothetical protein